LSADDREVFNPTDVQRLDGFPDHISCSIEYPNGWYFRRARDNDRLFQEWVVLLLKPDRLWLTGTKFARRNAAADGGKGVAAGVIAYMALFSSRVQGARGKLFVRNHGHPSWLPTDEQAEVLVPDGIGLDEITGIVVASDSQAKREATRARLLCQSRPRLVIAPALFDAYRLSALIRQGQRPEELEYHNDD
jgi:hypothetical protein